ncbi:MAG: hypothetical protein JW860_16280 [Sedimentisphaerales bacterium]|nr:hypothetical protein [Sedimentisphaerales bacterium]
MIPWLILGWKTSLDHWNDDAVWNDGMVLDWYELRYPPGHPYMGQSIDLAFVITGEYEPPDRYDFGDAPESQDPGMGDAIAYPDIWLDGAFPTCATIGIQGHVQHDINWLGAYFGPMVDSETDGNAGLCPPPGCFPLYDQDECYLDGDAGLVNLPNGADSFTIDNTITVVPCIQGETNPLGTVCQTAVWGVNIDIDIFDPCDGYGQWVNVLADWNRNGVWSGASDCMMPGDAPEHVLVNFWVPDGFVGPLSLLNPPPFLIGPYSGHIWFRFTIIDRDDGPLPEDWNGEGYFSFGGETEDYLLLVEDEYPDDIDWGDAPDSPAALGYPTLSFNNGANHIIGGPWLGPADDAPDPEPDGQPNATATGDDNDIFYPPVNDDEDGVIIPVLTENVAGNILYLVSGGGGDVNIWIDWNQNQSWLDPGEKVEDIYRGNGLYVLPVTPPAGSAGTTFLRARISNDGSLPPDGGPASDGEVEDHEVYIEEAPEDLDWGDAPDAPMVIGYQTLSINGGANHVIGGPWLGDNTDNPDPEGDGQPDPCALGDDNDGNDDEDGVQIPVLVQGQTDTITFEVNGAPVGAGAWVKIWLDWNGDGVWQDPCEVIEDNFFNNGVYNINVAPKYHSAIGKTFLRARISTLSGLSPGGSAPDGEVEDHEVVIEEGFPPVTKFRQVPLDPTDDIGPEFYYGHDELSTAYTWWEFSDPPIPLGYKGCYMADDFADPRTTPVVRVRWWGSYIEDVYEQPIVHFLIIFETDVAADDPDNQYPYSHPGSVILAQEVWRGSDDPMLLNPGEYSENQISPGGPPCNEDLYEYEAFLEIPFDQEPDTVYWIKIVALVDVDPMQMQILEQCLMQHAIDLCTFLNLSLADQMMLCPELMPLTRWGWHNRDYTRVNPYASFTPAVSPGEYLAGIVFDPLSGEDLEVWHFQDDAVTGDIQIEYMGSEYPFIYQPSYWEQHYAYFWPLCDSASLVGVDGPEEIEMYSKDLAFELLTPGCLTPLTAIDPVSGINYYAEWILVGNPECWCCKSQCYGDGDCLLGGSSKTGYYHVGAGDLSQLLAAWKVMDPTKGPGIYTVPYGICADYDHSKHGSPKTGYYRVGAPDLAILLANWKILEPTKGPGIPENCGGSLGQP